MEEKQPVQVSKSWYKKNCFYCGCLIPLVLTSFLGFILIIFGLWAENATKTAAQEKIEIIKAGFKENNFLSLATLIPPKVLVGQDGITGYTKWIKNFVDSQKQLGLDYSKIQLGEPGKFQNDSFLDIISVIPVKIPFSAFNANGFLTGHLLLFSEDGGVKSHPKQPPITP